MNALAVALAAAPRRYVLPALPKDVESARSASPELALALAIERARTGELEGARELFVSSLAALFSRAADADAGDPVFRAALLQAEEPPVQEYVALQAHASTDVRTVRRMVDAIAHPAKLAGFDETVARSLAGLHELAKDGRWSALRDKPGGAGEDLVSHPSLLRLARIEQLETTAAVARYLELTRSQAPGAGTEAASRRGRASAQAGQAAEARTEAVLKEIADRLNRRGNARLQVARGLKTPAGFPGTRGKAKDEWDVALIENGPAAARIVLLGEVKASPAAAPADYSRLHRGLLHLAQADADAARTYTFSSADGAVAVSGASLRELAPRGNDSPANVVYFSTAPAGQVLPPLSAASKAVLLREAASLAFARKRDLELLLPVWTALRTEPRLRATLHQYDTSRRVREALLHPEDLLLALQRID